MKYYIITLLFSITAIYGESEPMDDRETDFLIRQSITFAEEYKDYPIIFEGITLALDLIKEGKTQEASTRLESLLIISAEKEFQHAVSDIGLLLGEIYYNWGFYDRALKFFLKARNVSSAINYNSTEAAAFNFIGKYYHTTGNFKRSLNFYRKGIEIGLTTSDSVIISELYRNIGNYYNTTGNHSQALEVLYNSLEYLDKEKDPLNYASSCNHIGNVYQDQGNLEKALDYHKKALKLRKSINDKDEIGKSLKNLGEVYEEMGFPDSAVQLYKEAQKIFMETGYRKGNIKIYNNLGRIYVKQGNIENGLNYLKNALKQSLESGYYKGIMNAHFELGNCYHRLGDESSALKHYRTALNESKVHGLRELEREIYLKLYSVYLKKKDFENALQYYMQFSNLDDSIKKLQHLANIEELAVKYETRVQEQENNFLKQQNQIQQTSIKRKNFIIWISATAIISLLIAVYAVFRNLKNKKRDNHKLRELNDKLQHVNHKLNESNAEKDKLYSVFVHELRNPLLWFRNITRTLNRNFNKMDNKHVKKALESLDESATASYHLMDNLLQWTRSQLGKIETKKEIFDLDSIITENIQFANTALKFRNISINYIGESCLVRADRMMITTIVRNLISNAIKFTPEKGTIFIETEKKNSRIYISVKDTGIGISLKDQMRILNRQHKFTRAGILKEKGSGLGLLLCREFIEKNEGELYLRSEEGMGSEFIFYLPAVKTKSENSLHKYLPT